MILTVIYRKLKMCGETAEKLERILFLGRYERPKNIGTDQAQKAVKSVKYSLVILTHT